MATTHRVTCDFCKGTGHIEEVTQQGRVLLTCRKCKGKGKVLEKTADPITTTSRGKNAHATVLIEKELCRVTLITPGEPITVEITGCVVTDEDSIFEIILYDSLVGEAHRQQIVAAPGKKYFNHTMRMHAVSGPFTWLIASRLIKGNGDITVTLAVTQEDPHWLTKKPKKKKIERKNTKWSLDD